MWERSWIKRRNGQTEWLGGMAKRKRRRKIRADQQKERKNGLAEGERAKQLEIAKNLIKLGLNVDDIVKATGLSKEEIEKLTEDK